MSQTLKTLIFSMSCLLSLSAQGQSHQAKEALLKSLNTRVQTLLKTSIEAQVFLDEELTETTKLLATSKITWADSYSDYPFLMSSQNGGEIILSTHFGFKGTAEAKTAFFIKLLFNLKRQLEGSRDFLPEFRIKIFSRKFSPILFDEVDNCDISIHELKQTHSSIRGSLFNESLTRLSSAGYSYHSSRPNWVLVINGKEKTDTECRGNNRNIYSLEAELVNTRTGQSSKLFSAEGTSCGHSQKHYKRSLKRFLKKIKHQLPKCTETLDF